MSVTEYLRNGRCLLAFVITAFYLSAFCPGSVLAAEKDRFPAKTIRVIVARSPGGGADLEPRVFLPSLSKKLGVDMLIENIPGAGGKLGVTKAWKAQPNGYTLLYNILPLSIMTEYLFNAEFKTLEFTHVFGLLSTNLVLLVPTDNWKTMEEFCNYGRGKTLSGGIPELGGASHICGLAAADKLGIKVNWVPYSSSSELISAVAGKHLDFGITSTNSAQPMEAAGRIRALMVFARGPDEVFPEVPFPAKLGYQIPSMSVIRGFIAPPKTPANLVKTLSDAMFKAAADPAFVAWTKKAKVTITPLDGIKYLAEVEKQYAIVEPYKKLFHKSGD